MMQTLFDPFDILGSFTKVNTAWLSHWSAWTQRMKDFSQSLEQLNRKTCDTFKDLIELQKKMDSEDPNAFLLECSKKASVALRDYHRALGSWLRKTISDAPGLPPETRQRAIFWADQLLQTAAPSNCFWTNPGAVKRFLDSGGESLEYGFRNWLEDFVRGDNLIKLADEGAFKVGENLATTPGQVVYRNALFELIQYAPATERTWSVPLVMIQPWINKFYIFDLSPDNSFVRFLVAQGFTVFIVSWKNPTPTMRRTAFEDYMLKGAYKAIAVAARICGVKRVHAAGYCIGGTVLAALMAWLNHGRTENTDSPVIDWTLFTTLTDYSQPGNLGMFITESSLKAIELLMEKTGYLDAMYLGLTFRLLNAEGLIWRNLINNYLYGAMPPKSDMLFWNSDSTRLPESMCSYYLREIYFKNLLAQKDRLVLGGRPIDLGRILQPLYAVGAEQDHICPWPGTFQTGRLINGPVRYVLSGDGHITGIINPPSARSRKKFRTGDITNKEVPPEEWYETREVQRGSWWLDWVAWLKQRSPNMGPPPAMGSEHYPPLEPAPGRYVHER